MCVGCGCICVGVGWVSISFGAFLVDALEVFLFIYYWREKKKKNDKMEVCVLVGWRVNIMRCYSLVYRGVNDARILLQ